MKADFCGAGENIGDKIRTILISLSLCRKRKKRSFFFEGRYYSPALNKRSGGYFQKISWAPPRQTPGCNWVSPEVTQHCNDELTCWVQVRSSRPFEPSTTQMPETINQRCRQSDGAFCDPVVQREVTIVKPCPTPTPTPTPNPPPVVMRETIVTAPHYSAASATPAAKVVSA